MKGELISLAVAASWTVCAMFAEVASKRMGSLALNVIRMALSLVLIAAVMWIFTGAPYPVGADGRTWMWLLVSGFVGYVIGDYCLFNSYILIGSRYGQLLMTLAPLAAAVTGWLMLGEKMALPAVAGMLITVSGIALSLNGRKESSDRKKLPMKGIAYGAVAGLCQGIGLVLSAKGLDCYENAINARGMDFESMRNIIPFASTGIRAIMGLAGFTIWTLVSGHGADIVNGIRDRKGMLAAIGQTVTGPFIGVSLSLMAALYTHAGIAQTIMATTPVLILLPTYLAFHQKVSIREIAGAVVAVLGVSMFFLF